MRFQAGSGEKTLATLLSLALYPLRIGFVHSSGIIDHLLFCFCHANVFHLLGNLFFMWVMKIPLRIIPSFIISFMCSFIPSPIMWDFKEIETCGLSGVLFASLGMAWGKVGDFRKMSRYVLVPVLIYGLIPKMNFLMHVYCLLLGYIYETSKSYLQERDGWNPFRRFL